jgi:predicted DNA-binding transcriptional regulator AlpA
MAMSAAMEATRPALRSRRTKVAHVDPRQSDLFGAASAQSESSAKGAERVAVARPPERAPAVLPVANKPTALKPAPPPPRPQTLRATPSAAPHDPPETDEWWTTEKVCAFLRLGRKAIWERRRNREFAFPKPANLGGGRNHYRASAIRLWAERMAAASMLDD